MARFPLAPLVLAATVAASLTAAAQDRGDFFSLGVGVGVAPEFIGSDEYDFGVLPVLNFSRQLGPVTLRSRGLGVTADVLDGPMLSAGPIVRYTFGRDGADITDPAVAALPDIDGTIEAGGFAEVRLPIRRLDNTSFTADLTIAQGISGGHDGLLIEGGLGLARQTGPVQLRGGLTATWANESYTDTFFGIDAAGAAASGLPVYDPDGGLRDLGIEVGAVVPITGRIVGTAAVGYSELQGDAADSPIVADTGQYFALLGLAYRF